MSVCRCPTAAHLTGRRTQAEAGGLASAPLRPRTVSGLAPISADSPSLRAAPARPPCPPHRPVPATATIGESQGRGRAYQTPAGALRRDVTRNSTRETLGERTRPQRGQRGRLLPVLPFRGGRRAGAGTDRRGAVGELGEPPQGHSGGQAGLPAPSSCVRACRRGDVLGDCAPPAPTTQRPPGFHSAAASTSAPPPSNIPPSL